MFEPNKVETKLNMEASLYRLKYSRAFADLLKFFSSVKFTITLLILIIIASIAGTVILQNLEDEQYKAKYGDTFYRVLTKLQLKDVYHSYWYTALLAIFCVNLCVCSIRNLKPLLRSLRQPASADERMDLSGLPFYREIRPDTSIKDFEIVRLFTRSLYKLRHTNTDRGIYCFERGKVSRLGFLITHASIVIILVGGIVVGRLGFKEHRKISVGETINVPNSDFQAKVEDFNVEFYPDLRTPKEYITKLTIIEDGESAVTGNIEMNHPLKYRGIKFYQMSYGLINTAEIELAKKLTGEVLGRFKIDAGELVEVPNSQMKIMVAMYVPDFVIDESGKVGTRSMNPNNPAVLLELYEGDVLRDRTWSFLNFPDFHGSSQSDYSLKFLSIEPAKYYTELQISRDPGLPVIWIGCLIMMAGLFLSFYTSHKRVWVRLSADSGGTIVEMGGKSYKDRSGFEREYDRLRALLVSRKER